MAEPLVRIVDATKAYRGKVVLRVRDFSLTAGERVDVLGANGSGKSTLLRVIAGIAVLSTGRMLRSPQMRGLSVGFVPQQGGIYDELTVRENSRLIASMIGRSGSPDPSASLLAQFDLERYLDRPAAVLSDGMKRLVTFLSVWAAGPDILIADEPLAGMDAANGELLERLIDESTADHRTFVQSTHAPTGAGRQITIRNGEL